MAVVVFVDVFLIIQKREDGEKRIQGELLS